MVKIHVEQKEDLVGQIYKAYKNIKCSNSWLFMYYLSAGTLWNIFDSILCYSTSTVTQQFAGLAVVVLLFLSSELILKFF